MVSMASSWWQCLEYHSRVMEILKRYISYSMLPTACRLQIILVVVVDYAFYAVRGAFFQSDEKTCTSGKALIIPLVSLHQNMHSSFLLSNAKKYKLAFARVYQRHY